MILENNDRKIIIGKSFAEPQASTVDPEVDQKELLYKICKTIEEGGYNVTSQLMGYVISEDPAHVTNYNNARTLIGRVDRDELLTDMIKVYLERLEVQYGERDLK